MGKPRSRGPKQARMPIERFLSWRKNRRNGYVIVTLTVALLLMMADHFGLGLYAGDDISRYDGRVFTVTRVVDGDTLTIDGPDGSESYTRVRLWGVDTPETRKDDPPRAAEPYADEATDLTRRLVEGQRVRIILEPHRLRGDYGRLLAFVELPDGRLLNEVLLSQGLAEADGRWSHQHMERFDRVEKSARDAGRGLWTRIDR